MHVDGWLIFLARGARGFANGLLAVVMGLHLSQLGFASGEIGLVFTAALIGGAGLTIAMTAVADRFGRRRTLMVAAGLMALSAFTFVWTDQLWALLLAALIGALSPTGSETGPFVSIEQALLPHTVQPKQRTLAFGWYNTIGTTTAALGALFAGVLPTSGAPGERPAFWLCFGLAVALVALSARLSPGIELPPAAGQPHKLMMLGRSRGAVMRLAGLFTIDAFGGGFVIQSFMVYWLYVRFGVETQALATGLFWCNMLSAVSYLLAVRISRRIGLLNTMVFSQFPANLFLILVPLAPSFEWALGLLLARFSLSMMDIPTRQSYVVALVSPEERSQAAGITNVGRNAGQMLGPSLAGLLVAQGALALPFMLAGTIKLGYNVALLLLFRNVTPAEQSDSPYPPRVDRA